MFNREKILPKLKDLPETPGVYIMKDAAGTVIYVGKAVNLKRRVSQYFGGSVKQVKVQAMADHVDDFSYVLTLSEVDAFTLEATLIKKHLPRYNILLKDDKGRGSFVCVNRGEKYPSLGLVRHVKKDGAKYFGPFAFGISAKHIYAAAKLVYGLRTCHGDVTKKKRECLDYHIGLCGAPCTGKISENEYNERVAACEKFLGGRTEEAERVIAEKMQGAAESEDFERAIELRNILSTVQKISERKLLDLSMPDGDIFSYSGNGTSCVITVMMVRANKLLPGGSTFGDELGLPIDTLSSFIMQYYDSRPHSRDIYVNIDGDYSGLKEALGEKTEIYIPKKGQKADLVKVAEKNAAETLEKYNQDYERKRMQTSGAAEKLAEILGIPNARRIECYDISHISGTDKVASGVCFINGEKAASEYRRYRIKTVEGNNDFACMAEVLGRRFKRAKAGDGSFTDMPTLIVIDGGLGQLHAAQSVMTEAGFDIPMVGLAKREEEIYTVHSSVPVVLDKTSAPLKLLQRVRDEAHRFAITYNRNQRLKRVRSELDGISGIGEVKSRLLLKKYGSVSRIKELPLEALISTKGMTRPAAMAVYRHFHGEDE